MQARSVLRSLLRAPEWNQQKLAKRLGVSQSTIHRWMNGTEPEGGHRDALGELYKDWLGFDKDSELMAVIYSVRDECELVSLSKIDQPYAPIPPVEKYRRDEYNLIAARIVTDMFWPRLYRGSTVYWHTKYIPDDMIDIISVIALKDGRLVVGTLQHDNETKSFTVTGSAAPEIPDADIEWVAPIIWIQPDIPPFSKEISDDG